MFTDKFKDKVRVGDSISCTVDGITYQATIYRDHDAKAPDKEDCAFWPSLDPNAPGYIGPNPAKPFEQQQADCKVVMARWKAGMMIYCGVFLSASKAGVDLLEPYEAALWRVDVNWPQGNNDYLRTVANGLLPKAKDAAVKSLARQIEAARVTLAKLEA